MYPTTAIMIFFTIRHLLILIFIITQLMNIYDCFMYLFKTFLDFGSIADNVKKFIITESIYLHSGKKKKLNFDLKKFSKLKNKIEYIVIDKPPSTIRTLNENDDLETRNSKMLDNSLIRENHQRNGLIQGLNDTDDDDLIIVSDVDKYQI